MFFEKYTKFWKTNLVPQDIGNKVRNVLFDQFYLTFTEKAVAPHSNTFAWKIPWTEEPGGLQSIGLLRVGHDWATSLSFFIFIHWRRKWQPTPILLPGKSHGQRRLVGYCPWGRKESVTTERLHFCTVRKKQFGQSRNKAKLWMCLVMKVQYCKEQYCIGTWDVSSMN